LRKVIIALDVLGIVLLASGLVLLANLASLYLAIAVAGAACMMGAYVLSPERNRKDRQ
jgi:hypothetical protein